MNGKIWIILGVALICIVLVATAGCATYRDIHASDDYPRASDTKSEVFGGNGNDRKSS